jgi:hypothetical protein
MSAIQCPLLGVKQTSCGHEMMSANDPVDGARPAVSKCAIVVALKATATKEVKPLPTWELKL